MGYTAPLIALLLTSAVWGEPTSPGKTAGLSTATLRIELFSDFQCPVCKDFHEKGLRALLDDYVSKGKAYLVYREFPLPQHAYARPAAVWATAAARVGKYEAVCDSLFARQKAWSADGKVEDAACAALTRDEAQKVRALVKDAAMTGEIDRDVRAGAAEGVNGTPTLVVVHKSRRYPISGTLNYNLLRRVLDELLAQ